MNSRYLLLGLVVLALGVGYQFYTKKSKVPDSVVSPPSIAVPKGSASPSDDKKQTPQASGTSDQPKEQAVSSEELQMRYEEKIKELTQKVVQMEALVEALISEQEERAQNWIKTTEAGKNLLEATKRNNRVLEQRLKKIVEEHEKKITDIRNGYMRRCPCAVK